MTGRLVSTALALGLVVVPAAGARAQNPMGPDRMLLTDQNAVLVGVPELVAPAVGMTAEWSSDGRYVLSARTFGRITRLDAPPAVEESILVWSDETRRATTVWSQRDTPPGRLELEWLHGAEVALALVTVPVPPPPPGAAKPDAPVETQRFVLLRIDARKGTSRPLGTVKPNVQITASPSQPLAAVWSFDSGADPAVQVLRADGTVASNIRIPPDRTVNGVRWMPDGRSLALLIPVPVKEKAVRPTWFQVQADGGLTEMRGAPDSPAAGTVYPLRVRQSAGLVTDGEKKQTIHPLWLEFTGKSEEPAVLLAASGAWGKLSPRGDAVLYESAGSVWVSPLTRVPKELFLQARSAARRMVVINNAKQVGLSLFQYAQDYDETFPGQDKAIIDTLLPYTKSAQVLAGLVYTYPGGKLTDIQEPSKTELGYWSGEGGRAVIYADGHVVWKKDGE